MGFAYLRWRSAAALVVLVALGLLIVVLGPDSPPTAVADTRTDAARTVGVPHGTKLTRYDGDLVITEPGVYSGLDLHGFVRVKVADVTITDSVIRGGVANSPIGLINDTTPGARNLLIENSELVPEHPSPYIDGIQGWNFTATHLDIHGTTDGVKVFGEDVTVSDSHIHDLAYFASDPARGGGPVTNDGIKVLAGRAVHLVGNTITGTPNGHAALLVTPGRAPVRHLLFSGNRLRGGGCVVFLGIQPDSATTGWTVTGNRFARRSRCSIQVARTSAVISTKNVWDDGHGDVPVTYLS